MLGQPSNEARRGSRPSVFHKVEAEIVRELDYLEDDGVAEIVNQWSSYLR